MEKKFNEEIKKNFDVMIRERKILFFAKKLLKAETRKEKNKFARELIKLKNGGITK
jgi:hypothetical protein